MLWAQIIEWSPIVQNSALVSVVLFAGYGLMWLAKRTFGPDGIVTKLMEESTRALKTNTETLIALKDTAVSQQGLCAAHAATMLSLDDATKALVTLHKDPCSVFATVHLTDGAMAACDMLEQMHPESSREIDTIRKKLKGD